MARYIFEVTPDVQGTKDVAYVRATEEQMKDMVFLGGFRRFNYAIEDYAKNHPKGSTIDGHKILTIRQFCLWGRDVKMW